MNMVSVYLDKAEDSQILLFNPWLFSGVEQLTTFFLSELLAQLSEEDGFRRKAKKVGAEVTERLASYARALTLPLSFVPGAGGVASAAATTMDATSTRLRGDTSARTRRRQLEEALDKSDAKIFVLLDDIDRLTASEIRDVFRLVRLTGSFPNVVYILCFDRAVVESALTDGSVQGRDYLEKILRLWLDVPEVPEAAMTNLLLQGIQSAIGERQVAPLDAARWTNIFHRIVKPLAETPRFAKRLLAALPLAVESIGTEVALEDVIGLEAIRVGLSDLYAQLLQAGPALTSPAAGFGSSQSGAEGAHAVAIQSLLSENPGHEPLVRVLLEELFPAAARHVGGSLYDSRWQSVWRLARRVASSSVFTYYRTRQLPAGVVPADLVDVIVRTWDDEQALTDILEAVPDASLEDLLKRLLPATENAAAEVALAAIPAFIKQYPRLRTESIGFMDFGAEVHIRRLVLKLVERLADETAVSELLRDVVARSDLPLYGRSELVTTLGHREGSGHGLLPVDVSAELESSLASQTRLASPADLAAERHPFELIVHTVGYEDGLDVERSAPVIPSLMDPVLARVVLIDAITEAQSQSEGSLAVSKERRLAWDALVRVYGTEAELMRIVANLRALPGELDADLQVALDLCDRYASGWRPRF
jgi:hypothetical protein